MPFRALEHNGVLTSVDLDVLQEVYDAAAADFSSIDDRIMSDVVRTLITHYQLGERNRDNLIAMASQHLKRAAG